MTIEEKKKDIEKRVNRGIKWLNEVKPMWLKKIDLEKLDLANVNVCICGQVFGDFWKVVFTESRYSSSGLASLGSKIGMSHNEARAKGFDIDEEGYDMLTYVWYIKIKKLLKSK